MNLYKLEQDWNSGYDTYDSAVVAAESSDDARTIHPAGDGEVTTEYPKENRWWLNGSWAPLSEIRATLIGVAEAAIERGVIVASYNAG
jgi:hypothetical protein